MADKQLHADMEQRLARFSDPMQKHDEVVDTLAILSRLEQHLKELVSRQELLVCKRRHPCKCREKTSCDCDDDACANIIGVKFDVLSNCLFQIHLAFASDVKLNNKNEALRGFSLDKKDADEELPLFDVIPAERTFYVHNQATRFTFQEAPTIRFRTLIGNFNYMDYS